MRYLLPCLVLLLAGCSSGLSIQRDYSSANHASRVQYVVLHYTSTDLEHSLQLLTEGPVSSHYLIGEEPPTLYQLVDENRRAWHAGDSSWQGRTWLNGSSIGIELVNPGDSPFPEPQMAALERLLHQILARWGIPAAGVIGHSDMAPGRKSDPGPRFDWRRLAVQGLAVWPAGAAGDDLPLAESLTRIGYPDDPARLAAFRLRFRPWADGPEDATDRRIAAALAYSVS